MTPRLTGLPGEVARAYKWLEVARHLPHHPAERPRQNDTERQRKVQRVLGALVVAFEQGEPAALGHAERVAALSRRLALVVGLSLEEAEVVGQAGWFHDIGKLGPASRAGEELYRSTRHPIVGAQLVAPFEFLALAVPMIRHHHERLDGSGHPDGLRGLGIPVGARIIAVADEYDRLTAVGGAAGAAAHDAALMNLTREAGRTLDRTMVSALVDGCLP